MSTAGAPGPSPERVEGPTAPCGMRPTPTTQNCTLLGFRVQPPCLPPSSGEKDLVAWSALQQKNRLRWPSSQATCALFFVAVGEIPGSARAWVNYQGQPSPMATLSRLMADLSNGQGFPSYSKQCKRGPSGSCVVDVVYIL